jgi:hypothetical protein
MKFIYFYSEDYSFYHNHIQKNLSNFFHLEPVIIGKINIDENKHLNHSHHFAGITIKIELIIDSIKKNMGSPIIFSDATIFVNNKNSDKFLNYIEQYLDNDLVFADNNIYDANAPVNIGFILINCSSKTLTFFENVLQSLQQKLTLWDQETINLQLSIDKNIKYTKFNRYIYCRFWWDMNDETKENYFIFKKFINNENKTSNFNQRIRFFYENSLITKEEFDQNIM